VGSASAQQKIKLDDNAALRYWSAFAEMQDSAITDQQAKELNQIVAGTSPYDDLKFKELVQKNKAALDTMARGSTLRKCDWGLDYDLGPDTPVEYVRKALTLGRLNVLYAFHLSITGDKDGAVRALVAGLRFSRDVANGGTLFATLVADGLIVAHLEGVAFILHVEGLSAEQRSTLKNAVLQLGPEGLDWQSAMKLEFGVLHTPDSQVSAALLRIKSTYLTALESPSLLPSLQQMIVNAPQPLPGMIPNPERVLRAKKDLTDKLLQTRSMLQ
jgi:hypothetical protein